MTYSQKKYENSRKIHIENVKDWIKDGIKTLEIVPAPDGLPECKKMSGEYPAKKALKLFQQHAEGCRCAMRPGLDY